MSLRIVWPLSAFLRLLLFLPAYAALADLQESPPLPAGEEEAMSWLGQEYLCARRTGEDGLQSEEYLPRGESFADWRQRVIVRRSSPSPGFDPEVFVGRFKEALRHEAGVRLEDCGPCPGGRVLVVMSPGKVPDGRMNSCVLILYSPEAGLVLLQYSQRPERLDQALAELQLKAWRDRLLNQARGQAAGSALHRDPAVRDTESHG